MSTLNVVLTLAQNRYTDTFNLVDISTSEQDLINDFGEPVIALSQYVFLHPKARSIAVNTITGPGFAVGDVITGNVSAASGVIQRVTLNILTTVIDMTLTTNVEFQQSETVTNTAQTPTSATITSSTVSNAQSIQDPAFVNGSHLRTLDPNFNMVSLTLSTQRKLPSGFPFYKTFDASGENSMSAVDSTRIGYAKAAAYDFETYVKYNTEIQWNILKAKFDDFSTTNRYPL